MVTGWRAWISSTVRLKAWGCSLVRHCRVCHRAFTSFLGFRSHVSAEYRRFEKTFGRPAKDWEEIVDAFNGKGVPEQNLKDFGGSHDETRNS